LDSVWQMNKVLWGIGAFTAGLTAYYMSRQVGLVFTGQARWREASPALAGAGGAPEVGAHEATGPGLPAPPHGGEPKDAPWTMSLPLVLLAIASVLGGGINFTAFGHFDFLNRFLSPIFPYATPITLSTATKWTLSLVVLAFCLLGLGFGLRTWRTAEHPALEPVFLRRAWYWDATVAATVSGPLRVGADALAFVMDRRLVDGFVNGVGTVLGLSGRVVRRVQTGYLRTYAIGIGAGLIAFLAYVTFRVGS
jgi:NADH-quinone oxidoreductase subunit L